MFVEINDSLVGNLFFVFGFVKIDSVDSDIVSEIDESVFVILVLDNY